MVSRWTNWAGTAGCNPTRIERPRSEDEIVEIVRAHHGQRIKTVGTGHSFTDIACTDGVMIALDHYDRVLRIDREQATATVEAGISILKLSEALAPAGLALENMGDVGYQTISGAISTGTHGTGERFRSISSQVEALSIVTASGEVLDCSAESNPDVFRVARIGLGALGVLSTVTLRCVPTFNVRSTQQPRRIDDVLDEFDELTARNDHFEFFWWPHTESAQAITNVRTMDSPSASSRRAGALAWAKDVLIENRTFGLVQRAAQVRRAWIPRLAGITARTMTPKQMTDRSDRVFANVRLVRFAEMEYAVPRANLLPAFRQVRAMIEREGFLLTFPVEVRTSAAEDIPLSPAFDRESGYIAVHVYHGFEHEPYFREVERIMDAFEGRPHWGKLHFQTAETLRSRYPRWGEYTAVRDRLDPDRVFANRYLERVLGS